MPAWKSNYSQLNMMVNATLKAVLLVYKKMWHIYEFVNYYYKISEIHIYTYTYFTISLLDVCVNIIFWTINSTASVFFIGYLLL